MKRSNVRTLENNGEPSFPISERLYPVDFRVISFLSECRISGELIEFYRKGLSLREVAARCGRSKNYVRSSLLESGITLREKFARATNERGRDSGKQCARPYYGFAYLEGRIVRDPKEYPTLKLIYRHWRNRKNAHEITKDLRAKKILSRNGKHWSWAAVQNILTRFNEGKIKMKRGGRLDLK